MGGKQDNGVTIIVEGEPVQIDQFINLIKIKAPVASRIDEIKITETEFNHFGDFIIRESSESFEEITEISPDIAVAMNVWKIRKSNPTG